MSRVIAIVNQKGGVGKTTTAINLGASFAVAERKTLIMDMDPQGNATSGLGVSRGSIDKSMYEVLVDREPLASAIINSVHFKNLDLVPSDVALVGAEVELVQQPEREVLLRNALQPVRDNYDYILIDCPPSLGLLTLNALVAADQVLAPLQAEFFALEGMSALSRTVQRVASAFNPSLTIEGVVLTMMDRRNNLAQQVEADVRTHFGDRVYQTSIPRNVRVSEAPSHGLPVLLYDHACAGAQAYAQLAAEFLRRRKPSGGESASPAA
jgi:chromosome partitioning protein